MPGAFPGTDKVWAIKVTFAADAPETPLPDTVQLNEVPVTLPERPIAVVPPEHKLRLDGVTIAFGIGLTVTVKVIGFSVQPFAEAVTLTVAEVTGLLVVFFAVNAEIPSALPLVPNPTSTVLVQL